MPRSLFAAASVVLGICWLVAFVAIGPIVLPSRASSVRLDQDVDIIHEYYDAANEAIATRNDTRLRELIDPSFTSSLALSAEPIAAEDLFKRLEMIHRILPGSKIIPTSISATDDDVVAIVSLQVRRSDAILGFEIGAGDALWPEMEVFRLAGGRIVEHRYSADRLIDIHSVTGLPIETSERSEYLPPPYSIVDLSGVTLPPGAATELISAVTPGIIFVMSGSISTHVAANTPDEQQVTDTDGTVVVPAWSNVVLTNTGSSPSSILTAFLSIPWSTESIAPGVPAYVRSDLSSPHSEIEHIAPILEIAAMDQNRTISVGNLTLRPGAMVRISREAEVIAVVTSDTHLHMLTEESEPFRIDLEGFTLTIYSDDAGAPGGVLLNSGNAAANVWILAVTSASPSEASPDQ